MELSPPLPVREKTELSQGLEGPVVVVKEADLLQSIPNFVTWMQSFSLHAATLTTQFPKLILELMAYQTAMAKKSDCRGLLHGQNNKSLSETVETDLDNIMDTKWRNIQTHTCIHTHTHTQFF